MRCCDLKEAQVLVCKHCGFEVKVLKACESCSAEACEDITCCGDPMELKG
ncbi:MAG: hypothetical protein PHW56_00730 [Methanosarcinaceae archaeon]|nr:hypothetical protein [Methanosarcinaceae archaeon]